MSQIDILGLIASGFTITSFMPQIWRTWRTRDVSGMSLPTYIIMTTGTALWLIYGFLNGDVPIIVTNTSLFLMCSAITLMILVFGKK